jgi:hypothetical protein
VPLPTPVDHGLPDDATIVVPVPAPRLTLYRLLEHEHAREGDFEPSLSRNQAKRRGVPELFRGSVSFWLEEGQAVAASTRATSFVARLDLADTGLVHVASTEQRGKGHVDVWAHPQELLEAVVEVVRRRLH